MTFLHRIEIKKLRRWWDALRQYIPEVDRGD